MVGLKKKLIIGHKNPLKYPFLPLHPDRALWDYPDTEYYYYYFDDKIPFVNTYALCVFDREVQDSDVG